MLLVNPHLPWSGFFTWFESQLTTPDLDIYGVTLVGIPVIGIGFNEFLGWTHTNNTFDGMDLYRLELTEEGYLWNGEERHLKPIHRRFRSGPKMAHYQAGSYLYGAPSMVR